jgi:hypothetical protein
MKRWLVLALLLPITTLALAQDAAPKKLPRTYADGPLDPYYPHRDYPKLITPQ